MRVVFFVRCHGEPDDELENKMIEEICDVVDFPEKGWGILTVGRQYYHDTVFCIGHASAKDECQPVTPRGGGDSGL